MPAKPGAARTSRARSRHRLIRHGLSPWNESLSRNRPVTLSFLCTPDQQELSVFHSKKQKFAAISVAAASVLVGVGTAAYAAVPNSGTGAITGCRNISTGVL